MIFIAFQSLFFVFCGRTLQVGMVDGSHLKTIGFASDEPQLGACRENCIIIYEIKSRFKGI